MYVIFATENVLDSSKDSLCEWRNTQIQPLKKNQVIPKEKPMQANIFTHPKGKTKALETLDRT